MARALRAIDHVRRPLVGLVDGAFGNGSLPANGSPCHWLSSVVVGVCEHHQPLRGFPCALFSLEQGEDEGFQLEVGEDGALVTNDDALSPVCPHHLL